jgi:aminodeoxyfutalosine synthase
MNFKELKKRLVGGGRLEDKEALELFKSDDLFSLGELADYLCKRKNKNIKYFSRNMHINPGNICINRCKFCAFSKSVGEEGAYSYTIDEMVQKAKEMEGKISELHIVGGLNPEMGLAFYSELFKSIKQAVPTVSIKALTAVEIDYISTTSGVTIKQVLKVLSAAGLDTMPGGGAEIFRSGVRSRLCPEKISASRWLHIMETAHKTGIKTNATMLFGHLESNSDRVDHLRRLRTLQDKTGGFLAFIPLPFHATNTNITESHPVSGIDILKTIAISRIYLDNFDHIKAYWIMTGEKLAQTALLFGADDLDGTVIEEKITHAAGGKTRESMSVEEIAGLIKKAGMKPVERDSFYRKLRTWN